jgi:hypothetical protein
LFPSLGSPARVSSLFLPNKFPARRPKVPAWILAPADRSLISQKSNRKHTLCEEISLLRSFPTLFGDTDRPPNVGAYHLSVRRVTFADGSVWVAPQLTYE